MKKPKRLQLKELLFAIGTVLAVLLAILLLPLDHFSHGFYCTPADVESIPAGDLRGGVDLAKSAYWLDFTPQRDHFAGFELFFTGIPENASGAISLHTFTGDGAPVETVFLDLSELPDSQWYVAETSARYEKGVTYSLEIAAEDCSPYPLLRLADPSYAPGESKGDPLLIAFGYAAPTFTYLEKVLLILILVCVWTVLFVELFLGEEKKKAGRAAALFLSLTVLLTWTYSFNSFDEKNRERFPEFQATSETLVTGVIRASRLGLPLHEYGLGRYYDVLDRMYWNYSAAFRTDDDWAAGYSLTEPEICLWNSPYTENVAQVGNRIRFSDGSEFTITGTELEDEGDEKDYWLHVALDCPGPLDGAKRGGLSEIRFLDRSGDLLPVGMLEEYISQYGLQGKIFLFLSRFLGNAYLDGCRLLCSLGAAAVFSLIVLLLWKKYDGILAACFGGTFLLSPWIVNFARNLYWVEFTWFLPMLLGLICSIWMEKRWVRAVCIVGSFLSVFVKSLCGYEYLTVILLGMISVPVMDWVFAAAHGEKKRARLLFRTIFFLGAASVAGFLAAICIHARLRGDGDIAAGIRSIIETDVLRRVAGGSLNDFEAKLGPSLNASVWEVFKRYFHFNTEIVAGVGGNLFPLLCVLPLAIFAYDYSRKQLDPRLPVMYLVYFLTCISWFVLAKSHSYIHPHISFVLWYFGFVQVCFYVIAGKLLSLMGAFGNRRGGRV